MLEFPRSTWRPSRSISQDNAISDISALASVTGLHTLDLGQNQVVSLAPLAGHSGFITLQLGANAIADISALGSATELTTLDLSDNPLADLAPLAALPKLQSLNLARTGVVDVSPLAGVATLSYVDLRGTSVTEPHAARRAVRAARRLPFTRHPRRAARRGIARTGHPEALRRRLEGDVGPRRRWRGVRSRDVRP
jgi:Leucine-rich repeat (LRR) protein